MRAWQIRELGEPRDVLALTELPDPEPGPGQCHAQLTKLVADGAIKPLVGERLGLEEVPSALQRLADGDTVGRIVFTP